MSQESLAEELHISRQAVSRWETGESIPDTGKVKALCRIFHVPADYLLLDEIEQATGIDHNRLPHPNKHSPAKIHFRIAAGASVLAVGILLIAPAFLLDLIETYQPNQEWYPEWGPYATYLFRTWRVAPFVSGWIMSVAGITFLGREYKKM